MKGRLLTAAEIAEFKEHLIDSRFLDIKTPKLIQILIFLRRILPL